MTYDLTQPRAIAEATLDATCTIRRVDPDATATVDATTGAITRGATTVVYSGPCTVNAEGAGGAEGRTGSRDLVGRSWSLKVPASATGLAVGDEVTVDTVTDNGLADLVGVPLTIDVPDVRSRAVLRHIRCIDARPAPVPLP